MINNMIAKYRETMWAAFTDKKKPIFYFPCVHVNAL